MSSLRCLIFLLTALGLSVTVNAAYAKNARAHRARKATVITRSIRSNVNAEQSLNLNSADAAALQNIKGIGPKKADAIVAYREANGSFKSVEDLVKVRGIGQKRLAKIEKYLTV